jgi:hypothetical protein
MQLIILAAVFVVIGIIPVMDIQALTVMALTVQVTAVAVKCLVHAVTLVLIQGAMVTINVTAIKLWELRYLQKIMTHY